MNIQVVSSYKRLLSNVSEIIDISGYRNDYIAKKLGLTPQNFSTKKQKGNWTPDELEKLLSIINNEDVENFLLLEEMRRRKDDETITFDEYKKILSEWR